MTLGHDWCWRTAEVGWGIRREAWSSRVCVLKKRTPYTDARPEADGDASDAKAREPRAEERRPGDVARRVRVDRGHWSPSLSFSLRNLFNSFESYFFRLSPLSAICAR